MSGSHSSKEDYSEGWDVVLPSAAPVPGSPISLPSPSSDAAGPPSGSDEPFSPVVVKRFRKSRKRALEEPSPPISAVTPPVAVQPLLPLQSVPRPSVAKGGPRPSPLLVAPALRGQLPVWPSSSARPKLPTSPPKGGLALTTPLRQPSFSGFSVSAFCPKALPPSRPPPRSLAIHAVPQAPAPIAQASSPLSGGAVRHPPTSLPSPTPSHSARLPGSKPPASSPGPAEPAFLTRAGQESSRKSAACVAWAELLQILGDSSGLFCSLRSSRFRDDLIQQSLAPFTPGTVEASLYDLLQNRLIRSFLSQPVQDRKEALPLPLAVVVGWERRVCCPSAPQEQKLLLGSFLLALHGGLRFGDLQRVRLNTLSLTPSALRGICWQTKTTRRGQPFAVHLHGLSGRDSASSWVLSFLHALQAAWEATEQHYGLSASPDFVLPALQNLGGHRPVSAAFHRPMSYSQALGCLRFFLSLPWRDMSLPAPVSSTEEVAFTLHSLKVCLLAAGAQIRASEDARQHHGHHKSPSVQLYSRDDTILAFDLQRSVAVACADGWRPARPIARGGQPPTLEPPFSVPREHPPSSLPVHCFGPGISRFLYSREQQFAPASLPKTVPYPASESAQPPEPDTPTLPTPASARDLPFLSG